MLIIIILLTIIIIGYSIWVIYNQYQQRTVRDTQNWQYQNEILKHDLSRQTEQLRLQESTIIELNQKLNHTYSELQVATNQYNQLTGENKRIPLLEQALNHAETLNQQLQTSLHDVQIQLATAQQTLAFWQSESEKWANLEQHSQNLNKQLVESRIKNEELQTKLNQTQQYHDEKIDLLIHAREILNQQFQQIANTILEEKSQKFQEQNQHNLQQLLSPLHERIHQFSQLIQGTYEKDVRERATLETELKRLQNLNNQLHHDAKALTDALIGTHNKNQGNWGEMILEKILESSGLQKDREYYVQVASTRTDESGVIKRFQPDVVINLPENRQIIIDAKVSLTAYVRYTQADNQETQKLALTEHIHSIRQHIKTLAEKDYSRLNNINSLDFVLMFVPIEPAYLLALQHDYKIFDECFAQRIILAGPSTLLATLKTISYSWRSEQQNQNALDIAREGGLLLDKFSGFVTTLESVGKSIGQANSYYQTAMNQLSTGKGNLITRAQKLQKLGVKSTKMLPENYLNNYQESD